MAAIGTLRKHGALIVGMVFFSLVAFILGDFLTSGKPFFGSNTTDVAEIGGKKIKVIDFEGRVQQLIDGYKLNSKLDNVDQNTTDQLREQAWSQLLNDEVMGKQYNKTGIKVGPEELFDMVQGKNIHPQIREAFKDPKTGLFNPANVINFLKNMDNDQTGKARAQWVLFEKGIREERLTQKYNDLIGKGIYVTSEEAKRNYEATGNMASIKYMTVNYNTISDSSVQVTDDDLEKYYGQTESQYKQEASRSIEYVTFDVLPSEEDRQKTLESLKKEEEGFRTSTDDSLFVSINSDENKPDITFHKKGSLPPQIDTLMFGSPVGFVYGPYEDNGYFKYAKLSAVRNEADSIKISHALISFKGAERASARVQRSHDEAKLFADSLFRICEKNPNKFIEVASYYSDDSVSATKAGDLDWITRYSGMDEQFKEGAFSLSKGGVKLVETIFGFHIIKLFDMTKPEKQIRVSIIDRKIEPGTKTYQRIFAKANEFAGKNTSAELFDKACKEQNLAKRNAASLKETDKNLPGIQNAREVIRWAYKAKKDEVSKSFELENKFLIAKVTDIKTKGIAPLDQVKPQLEAEVRRQKKFEMIAEKFNTNLAGATSLETVGQKMQSTVLTADNVNYASPYIQNLGSEPELVGTVFALKPNQISKPIKGNTGVFVVQLVSIKNAPPVKDYTNNKNQILQGISGRAQYEVNQALRDKANIKDHRGLFY